MYVIMNVIMNVCNHVCPPGNIYIYIYIYTGQPDFPRAMATRAKALENENSMV